MRQRTTSLLLIAVVALGAMTGVAAADGHLEVGVEDADGEPTVTVTENDTAVENATVIVSVVDEANESYAGTGQYQTDANGTVPLPVAEEDVSVEITAASGNETIVETFDFEAPDGLELDVEDTDGAPVVTVTDDDTAVENATVNVTTADGQNASYAGDGDYTTDENGTVELTAAEENVTVDVTAEYDNESVTQTVDLTVGEDEAAADQPFGQLVREFIESIEDREGGIGGAVSDFVTENNPGNAPDHAGGPGGPADAENASDDGNASAPGNSDKKGGERGPPDHAGPNGDDGDDAEEGDGDAEGDESEDDDAEADDDEEDDAEDDDTEADDADEDDAEDDDAEDEEEADDDDDDEEEEDDGGPPDHAGGPGGN